MPASMDYSDLLLDALCVIDADGRFVSASPACERIFGYTPEELVGREMLDLVFPEDRQRTRETAARVMAGHIVTHFENRYRRKDGTIVHIMWSARWSEADQVRVGLARDVTALKRAESRQAAVYAISEAAYAADDLAGLLRRIHAIIGDLLCAPNFLVALYDAETDCVCFPYHIDERHPAPSPGPLERDMLIAEVIRSGRALLLAPERVTRLPARLRPAAERDACCWLGVPLQSSQGCMGALVIKHYSEAGAYGDAECELLQFVSTQIASAIDRKQMFDCLQRMAQYDALTGLVSRGFFHERFAALLGAARCDGRGLALLYLDLDGFKPINDTHGHTVGDRVLVLAAQRLRGCVRGSDVVARLGGDEFVVLLEDIRAPDQAEIVVAAIRRVLGQPFEVGGERIAVDVSIGIAVYPAHGNSAQELLRHADAAMYQDKHARRTAARRTPMR